jgi:hypothetical protein
VGPDFTGKAHNDKDDLVNSHRSPPISGTKFPAFPVFLVGNHGNSVEIFRETVEIRHYTITGFHLRQPGNGLLSPFQVPVRLSAQAVPEGGGFFLRRPPT